MKEPTPNTNDDKSPGVAELNRMADRFARADMRVDVSRLSPGDRKALAKLIEAARILDRLFLQQIWSGNLALYAKLRQDTSPLGHARLHYFLINRGPWSELDDHTAFLPGVPPKNLPGANFYPENMTRDEFESWVKELPEDQQKQAIGFFTAIRRDANSGRLTIVPYSTEYREELQKTSALLQQAAEFTDNATLKRFLDLRAKALLSDDYYASDVAWMDVDAAIDPTFGPYETYNDRLFGYKAAFEAYISLRDDQESAKLQYLGKHLQDIENNLPIDPKYRNPKLGGMAPIRVVNEIIATGDGAHGVRTAAYNLPNDERVVHEKGSKRVMLKNVQEAKFQNTLVPIAGRVLPAASQPDVSFSPFFTHIVAHELSHGIGPHRTQVRGRETTVRQEMKEHYSAIEEAKADITGLFMLQFLFDHGKALGVNQEALQGGPAAEARLYSTFLASAFRTLRFGADDAHGKGMALQFNYLMEKGAFVKGADGTYTVNFDKIKPAVRDLTKALLTLEATADYAGAAKMLSDLGQVRPELQKTLDGLKDIPTDIEPVHVTANELAPEQ